MSKNDQFITDYNETNVYSNNYTLTKLTKQYTTLNTNNMKRVGYKM